VSHYLHVNCSYEMLGLPCTRHCVFLVTLVVTAKYLNDSSPKNKHWAAYAISFEREELNLMEK
jgi:G1/S-specific cyclin PLC1